MSRSWTLVGLSPAAKAMLEGKVRIGTRVITQLDLDNKVTGSWSEPMYDPTKRLPIPVKKEIYLIDHQFLDQEHHLTRYTYKDGRQIEEYVQAEPWSGGPNTYVALRDTATGKPIKESLWPEDEIN